jgi:aspartyl-tRNA(Asn)/glutamyl-tRNA(Gln) amidotransferase subunit A
MADDTLTTASAWEVAELVQTRHLSPVEVTAHFLDRIQAYEGVLNAFVTVAADAAMTDAHRAEAAVIAGEPLGPLHGVPIAIKDLSATKGITTTYGSLLQGDNVPEHDSILVERIRASGAIIVGKTTTPEYGWKGTTESLLTGQTHNPWDPTRTTAGSSGGSAAAVAAHVAPLASGSDGGGSIRMPASFCGIYGVKPTFGRVPATYTGMGGWGAMAQDGPLSSTVRDAALLLSVTAGSDPRDPRSITGLPPDFLRAVEEASVDGVRIAWSSAMDGQPVDAEVAAITAKAAWAFEEMGAFVEEATPEIDTATAFDVWSTLVFADYAVGLGPVIAAGRGDLLPPQFVDWLNEAINMPATRYARAMREREWHRRRFEDFFDQYDLLLTPTMAVAAFPIERHPRRIGRQDVDPMKGYTPFCFHANLAGLPAASLPCGFNSDGMPVGLQIVGPWGEDERVLSASAAFEAARPWSSHHPARFP